MANKNPCCKNKDFAITLIFVISDITNIYLFGKHCLHKSYAVPPPTIEQEGTDVNCEQSVDWPLCELALGMGVLAGAPVTAGAPVEDGALLETGISDTETFKS